MPASGFDLQGGEMGQGMGDFLGAGLMGFGMSQYQNPADSAMPYLNQIQGTISPYYQPYINAGNNALNTSQGQYGQLLNQLPGLQSQTNSMQGMLPGLQNQYSQMTGGLPSMMNQYGSMMSNPGQFINQMGQNFQQSPGYNFQVQQAQNAANHTAAAGGMLGSPAEQQGIAGTVNNLANQDYYNYLDHSMGAMGMGSNGMQNLFNQGMQGKQNLFNTGFGSGMNMYNTGLQGFGNLTNLGYGASNDLASNLANSLMTQAQLQYAGTANQNMSQQGSLGGIGGMISGGLSDLGLGGFL